MRVDMRVEVDASSGSGRSKKHAITLLVQHVSETRFSRSKDPSCHRSGSGYHRTWSTAENKRLAGAHAVEYGEFVSLR